MNISTSHDSKYLLHYRGIVRKHQALIWISPNVKQSQ